VRGSVKLPVVVTFVLTLVLPAGTKPLALIVLNIGRWNAGSVPPDWQVKVNYGQPEFGPCSDPDGPCLHLKSTKASFALERRVDIIPTEMPLLTWRWKVTQLPAGADVRKPALDDQAAQLLVAFADRRILTYIWDTTAPKGTVESASAIPLVHIFAVVCQSGPAEMNHWVTESHNLAADYQRAFGKPAPRVSGLRIQINSQHTGTVAESYFGDVAFRSTLQ
jgi:hypothetical protein